MILQKTITPAVIDETEQALQAFLVEKWQATYENRLLSAKKRQTFFSSIAKWLGLMGLIFTGVLWFFYSVLIVLDKVVLDATRKFDYGFWTFLTIFTLFFWLFLRYRHKFIDKINTRSRMAVQKNIARNAPIHTKRIFKTARQQTQPFTAIYEFDGNKIHYFRQIDEQKTHQWTRTIEPHYEMGENFVLFFKKPTAYSPKIFMFIDEYDKQNLVNYLTH